MKQMRKQTHMKQVKNLILYGYAHLVEYSTVCAITMSSGIIAICTKSASYSGAELYVSTWQDLNLKQPVNPKSAEFLKIY